MDFNLFRRNIPSLLDFRKGGDYGDATKSERSANDWFQTNFHPADLISMSVRDMHSPIHNYSIVLRRHHRQGSWQFMASRLAGNWIVCRRLTERPSHNSLRQQEWLRHCCVLCGLCISVCLLRYFSIITYFSTCTCKHLFFLVSLYWFDDKSCSSQF